MSFEAFLEAYGLAAIFGVMLFKSIGVPIPIPADVVLLATSARAATGKLDVGVAFVVLLIALSIGGSIQFALVRGIGRKALLRYGRFLGITEDRLNRVVRRLENRGVLTIGLAILTPGIRSVTIPACGIAAISFGRFAAGLVLGSGLFLGLHFIIGLLGGSFLNSISAAISPALIIAVVLLLLALGFGVWIIIRRRQHPNASSREILASAAGAWHEATCPVCLALGAVERLQVDLPHEHHDHNSKGNAHARHSI
jgi:membrane protein DedA with SNARE-associated domain